MNRDEKQAKCVAFYEALTNELKDTYEVIPSCNNDISSYLCPNGTTGEISYSGKPEMSFRISDHWNWYSNVRKCRDESYVQCFCPDLPHARDRIAPGKASTPIRAVCVCLFRNGEYHVVYGETFNPEDHSWGWVESDPAEVAASCGKLPAYQA